MKSVPQHALDSMLDQHANHKFDPLEDVLLLLDRSLELLKEQSTVPSLRKALRDVAMEKDASIIARTEKQEPLLRQQEQQRLAEVQAQSSTLKAEKQVLDENPEALTRNASGADYYFQDENLDSHCLFVLNGATFDLHLCSEPDIFHVNILP
ncbi:hypothetical protein C5167_015171 [Papaver somniferum]|uniref:Uncharacterized protein n=1 Tax=Papaver somniferum TaxID=3469 RepID=A0A4Y7J771_PAPSO|nr:hypothetical protein C5167_015171 [Papaver somniferum]